MLTVTTGNVPASHDSGHKSVSRVEGAIHSIRSPATSPQY